MLQTHNKIFKFDQEQRLVRIPFVIYADTECLLEKISSYLQDPQKSFVQQTCTMWLFIIDTLFI